MFYISLFGVLPRFQYCTGHITTGSWKGRGNQYIQFIRVLYCKLLTNGKQLPAFPLEVVPETEPRPQRWNARVLPLCHSGPHTYFIRVYEQSFTLFHNTFPHIFILVVEHSQGWTTLLLHGFILPDHSLHTF